MATRAPTGSSNNRRATSLVAAAVTTVLIAASIGAAQETPPVVDLHQLCYTDAVTNVTWRMDIGGNFSNLTRISGDGATTESTSQPRIQIPQFADCPDCITFVSATQAAGLFPLTAPITQATWRWNQVSRADTMILNASDGSSAYFRSTTCANWGNCPFRRGTTKHCWDGVETCCGFNTNNPLCIPNGIDLQCCQHFQAASACALNQTCCGALGPGTSSYSFCCEPGSSCCTARVSTSGFATCCPNGTTCCQGASIGLCCQADEICDATANACVRVANGTTGVPTTTLVPTPVVTTTAPISTDPQGQPIVFVVQGTLTIPGDFTPLLNNETKRAALTTAVEHDIARALSLPEDDVTVTSMRSGSLIVDFSASCASSIEATRVSAIAANFAKNNISLAETTTQFQQANPGSDGTNLNVTNSTASTGNTPRTPTTSPSAAWSIAGTLMVAAVLVAVNWV